MEYRTLEMNLISAKGLQKVNFITKMDVYAVVSIKGGATKDKQKTAVDRDGDDNPTWNFPLKFTIDESAAQQNRLTLVVKLICERSLGDKDVGEVHVPIKELLNSAAAENKPLHFVRYQVRKPSGKPKGELNFSYKFIEKITGAAVATKADEPVTAYPATAAVVGPSSVYPPPPPAPYMMAAGPYPPHGGGYVAPYAGYPPPPPVAGYGYPPQQYGGYPPPPPPGYGYPPQHGYGYPPVQQPPKQNKFGMGLGAGLLGGALGGLLIGDMVSDASSYDAGYDAGFGDGGFDGGF